MIGVFVYSLLLFLLLVFKRFKNYIVLKVKN
jgi:hypothetical protein